MKKRLTSFFLILVLAGGTLAGMPLHSGNMNSQMSCCKRVKSAEQTPQVNLVRLCCVMNCSDTSPMPFAPSFNFSPSAVIINDSIIKQIASLLLTKKKPAFTLAVLLEREHLPRKIPPKYIQHHSFLI